MRSSVVLCASGNLFVALYRLNVNNLGEQLLGTFDFGPDGGRYQDNAVVAGTSYVYRLGLFDQGGEVRGPVAAVSLPPAELAFAGIAPNPVDKGGTLTFTLPRAGRATLALYAVDGRRLRVVADHDFGAGTQHLDWDGTDDGGHRLSPGVYFMKLTFAGQSRVTRTLVLR
jgi:hypothetical protein